MLELVDFLVKELVGEDGDYIIESLEKDGLIEIMIEVAKKDIGKVIGKQGRIAKAIRTLVRAASPKVGPKYNVSIVEKED